MKTTEIEWIRKNLINDASFKLFKKVEEKRFCIEFIVEETAYNFAVYFAQNADNLYYQLNDTLTTIIQDEEFIINVLIPIDSGYFLKGVKIIVEEILEVSNREFSRFVPKGSNRMVYLKPFGIL